MKHIGPVVVALTFAFAAGSAWADVANVSSESPNRLSKEVAKEILSNAAVGPYGVRVRTSRDGMVHLTGSVIYIRDWKQADEDARDVAGATDVQNDLTIMVR